jgi:hypothetical protein
MTMLGFGRNYRAISRTIRICGDACSTRCAALKGEKMLQLNISMGCIGSKWMLL